VIGLPDVTGTRDGSGTGDRTGTGDHAAWVAVLDDLERSLAMAAHPAGREFAGNTEDPEDASTTPLEPWSPPAGLGPLPVDLADRAERLLRAQLDAGSLLQEARGRVARHLVVVRSVDPARPARDSVYLDVLG
jgi:hypothetical protein